MENKTTARMIELDKPLDITVWEYVTGWVKSFARALRIMAILGAGWLAIRLSTWGYTYGMDQYEKARNWAYDYVLSDAVSQMGHEKIELGLGKEGGVLLKHGKDLTEKEKILALTWNLNQLAMCRNTAIAVSEMLNPAMIGASGE